MVDGEAASASRLRKAYAEEDWETFKKLLPHESLYDDVVQALMGQSGGPVNENFLLAFPQSFLVEGKKTVDEALGADSKKATDVFAREMNRLLTKIVSELGITEMSTAEKAEYIDATIEAVKSELLTKVQEPEDAQQNIQALTTTDNVQTEMSVAANVSGYSGKILTGENEDEQKRRTVTRN